MKEFKVSANYNNVRLDRFIRNNVTNLPQSAIEIAIRQKNITVNNNKHKSNFRLAENDIVQISENLLISSKNTQKTIKNMQKSDIFDTKIAEKIKKKIIYKDTNILVLNKPAGIAVQGGTNTAHSIDKYLLNIYPQHNSKLVHRIDKDTSGVLVMALNELAARELAKKFKNKEIIKKYWAVVVGQYQHKEEQEIKLKLANDYKVVVAKDGKKTISRINLIDNNKIASLLEIQPITGKKHQLRVVCNSLSHPILGDGKYGGKEAFIQNFSNKMHLHAREIEIKDFFGKNYKFIAPLPKYIIETIKNLGFNVKI